MTSPETSPGFRLSPQQARLWSQLDDVHIHGAPHAGCVLLLEGALDRERLRGALNDLVERHEILRTQYRALPGSSAGVQVPVPPIPIEVVEGTVVEGDADPSARLVALVDDLRSAHPAPRATPLGVTLTALGPERHALVIDLPALSADRRSLAVLTHLVGEAYAARGGSEEAQAALQYADVAEVLSDLLESPDTAAGRGHWREIDLDPLLTAALPSEAPRQSPARFAVRTLEVPITPAFTAALTTAAAAAGVTPTVLVMAAWQALVHRLGTKALAEPRWSVAVAFDGRTYDGLDGALGLFERRLPLDLTIDGRRSLADLAREVAAKLEEAAAWQDYFILDQKLAGSSGASYFPIGFAAIEWPAPVEANGLRVSAAALETVTDRFDLELLCIRHAGRIELQLRHAPGRYTSDEIARLAERLACFLDGAFAQPDAPIAALPIIGRTEAALLASFHRTGRDWPLDRCIHELFEVQARRTPDRDAVVFGEQRLTYAELSDRSSRLAAHLRSLGVGAKSRVGLCLERGTSLLVGVLGALKAGAAYVPLDPMVPTGRIAHMLAQAEVAVVVTQEALRSLLPNGLAGVVTLDGDAARIAVAPPEAPPGEVGPDHLAYVIFTSGSTGKPKGVMIQHRSVVNLAAALSEAIYQGRGEGLRVSLNAPLAFDASVKQWVQLLAGHTIVIVPEEARPDPAQLCDVVRRHRLDVLDCTPSQLAGMLQRGLGHDADLLPSLVLVGGEAIDEATWRALAASPRTTFVNVYGPTECTVDATSCAVPLSPTPALGRPLGNVRVHVLDAALDPAPIGVVGELCIGGAGVGRGYCASPALTAERFVPDPAGAPGARLYRTGDLARLRADGMVEFHGRGDGQVKLRGLRIELGEIEAALKEAPMVREAAVVPREIAPGEVHLVGYFVPRDGVAATPETLAALRVNLRLTLPEYMIPWALLPLVALPLTPNGKLDRAALPDPRAALGEEAPHEPPTSEAERTVAAIWQEVLGVPRVGLQHNFFDLGGHSLLMVRVHERLTKAFNRQLSLVELFRHPTVGALAAYITGAHQDTATAQEDPTDRARRQRLAMEKQAQRNRMGKKPR